MTSCLKALSAVLPVALLAGPLGAGPTAADPVMSRPPTTQTEALRQTQRVPFLVSYMGRVTVQADRTATDLYTKRIKIWAPSAIAAVSQQHETFVEGMETLDIVEAFTEKADGARIPVDPTNIITQDGASGLQTTFLRDLKQRTIIFPDVQVGDTLVVTMRRQILHGMFPGEFFYVEAFPRNVPTASAEVIIEAPATLNLNVRAIGSGLSGRVEDAGNVRRHTFTLAPRPFALPEVRAVAPLDVDPMVLVSTFDSYADMGRAYGKAALPKIAVTREIAALADEITKGIKDRRQQAVAIDAWMKQHIRYVGVYLAVGRVVPHDAASVLRNKFGDCKDKATLMAALLTAKGIASEHALINMGAAYTLPEPPNMAALNHVILYLPEFDLYDDPTLQFAAFGVLAPENYDKPVVRVSAAGAMLNRTPAMQPQDHVAHAHTTIMIAADGTVTGRTSERNTGIFGLALRGAGAAVENVGSENAAQRRLQSLNTAGSGQIDIGNARATSDPVVVEGSFTLNDKFRAPAQGATGFVPFGMPLTVRPSDSLLGSVANNRTMAFTCFAGRQVEDIDTTFDAALPMPIAPASVTIDNVGFSFQASFKVEGRTLKAHREFVSHVAHQTCEPAFEAAIAADMKRVRGSMSTVYRFYRPESAAVRASPNPAQTKPVVISRAVVAGQMLRLDFLYSINPDCTAIGYATVRVLERPKHGKITVVNGVGFTNFPTSNPRAECNKRQSDGVVVIYQPEPGYTGTDSLDCDAVFPSGSMSRRHYAIDVR